MTKVKHASQSENNAQYDRWHSDDDTKTPSTYKPGNEENLEFPREQFRTTRERWIAEQIKRIKEGKEAGKQLKRQMQREKKNRIRRMRDKKRREEGQIPKGYKKRQTVSAKHETTETLLPPGYRTERWG